MLSLQRKLAFALRTVDTYWLAIVFVAEVVVFEVLGK